MFIDIHAHAFRVKDPLVGWNSAEELIATYDRIGIEKGAVLPIVSPEVYLPQANEDILEMAEKYPDRLIPFCNIDPRAINNSPEAPLDNLLQHYKDKGCKGIGEVMANMELMNPLVQNLFRCAEKVGLPIIYDGSDQKSNDFGIYDDPGLPQLEHTLQRFPNLKIFGHGPVFWAEIGKLKTPGERSIIMMMDSIRQVGITPKHAIDEEGVVPVLFRRYPNLYGDLSDETAYNALTRDEEYGPKFLEEFQDRLCFGTDSITPYTQIPLPDKLIKWRDTGKISETAFKKISRENAIRIFDL